MSSFYLSGAFPRRNRLRAVSVALRTASHSVSSGWLSCKEPSGNGATAEPASPEFRQHRIKFAREDFEDIARSHIFVQSTEDPKLAWRQPGLFRGGRHIELGYARAIRDIRMGC